MENTYPRNSSVIPTPEVQYLQVMHQILHRGIKIQLNPSNLGSKYSLYILLQLSISIIPFHSIFFHNTTKRKELFSLKRTIFVYVLSSDWLNLWFDTYNNTSYTCNCIFFLNIRTFWILVPLPLFSYKGSPITRWRYT